jgi:translocation and assembly module TamA
VKPPFRALVIPVGLISLTGTLVGGGLSAALAQPQATETPLKASDETATDDIISDKDFDAALPALDATKAEPAPQVPATRPAPVIAPPVQAEPVKDLEPDPELATPMGNLEQFNTEALNTASDSPDTAGRLIAYDYDVTGLEGLKDLKANFEALSALKAGKGKAANATMIRVRANADEALILRILQSAGYYDARARTTIRPKPERAGRLQAEVRVTPGKPYFVGEITFSLPERENYALPPGLLRSALKLNTGDALHADHILSAEAQLGAVLPENGYPFAKIEGRDIELDPATAAGDYTLNLDPGPKSVFGEVQTDSDKPFKIKHIRELSRFQRGQVYEARLTEDLHQALSATGLYRSVSAEPVLSQDKTADGATIVNIRVHQEPGKTRTLAAEAGYATGEGYNTTLSWTHRNLYPPEGALILSATAGDLTQGLSSTFRRTNAGQRDRTLQFGVALEHSTLDTYEAYTSSVSGSLSRLSTPLWQKVWTGSLGFEALVTREQALDTQTNLVIWRRYKLLNLPAKLTYDRSDNLLNPAHGYRLGAQLSPQISFSDTASSNARLILDASLYQPLTRRITLATRTRLGVLAGGSLNNIAPSQRLYAGGGGSVRGYAYQALGPVDITNAPTGGRSLSEISLELRYRVGDFGLVPFIDAGQVYDTASPRFNKLQIGAGVGVRYYTSFGPLRIDVATPLNRRTGDASVAVYVGIGQTF